MRGKPATLNLLAGGTGITPAHAGKTIQLCFKHRPTRCRGSFFIDDYQFERVWNDPYTYIERLREFPCALTSDFSLYLDMPMAMKIWNVYRSRLIGQMMQDADIVVIPTLSWA